MGYSDLGCFGSEIKTPNLDALAARGLRATNFCVGPSCSPTRSMLLTGADNHVAGLGNMAEFVGPKQKGKPGYEGHLNDHVVSVASVMRDAGYHTYMAGKWHLGNEAANSGRRRKASSGTSRCCRAAGVIGRTCSIRILRHPRLTFTRNGKLVDKLPKDYFSSAAYSDFILECLNEHRADDQPFFAYLSFQAVHAPLAVPDDWLDKYKGQYDAGYDAARQQRLERMRKLGLVGKDVTAFPRLPNIPAWDKLTKEQQSLSARRMEIYAAMLANMDHHIGRVLDHLKAHRQARQHAGHFHVGQRPGAGGVRGACGKAVLRRSQEMDGEDVRSAARDRGESPARWWITARPGHRSGRFPTGCSRHTSVRAASVRR